MTKSIRIALPGAPGRMGRMIAKAIAEAEGFELVAASASPDSPHIGEDAGKLIGQPDSGVVIAGGPDALVAAKPDVIIDFTIAEASIRHVELAAKAGIPVMLGTTGHDDAQRQRLAKAAESCAVAWCSNTSVGLAALADLVERAAAALGGDWDIGIEETHHVHKVDKPSGTALTIREAVARGLDASQAGGIAEAIKANSKREGEVAGHHLDAGTVGGIAEAIKISSRREGEVVGEHKVVLSTRDERMELVHEVTDRMVFARGALRAARWIAGRKAGLYSMRDILAG